MDGSPAASEFCTESYSIPQQHGNTFKMSQKSTKENCLSSTIKNKLAKSGLQIQKNIESEVRPLFQHCKALLASKIGAHAPFSSSIYVTMIPSR